jgi:cob(I)alamin adenosyltransferase
MEKEIQLYTLELPNKDLCLNVNDIDELLETIKNTLFVHNRLIITKRVITEKECEEEHNEWTDEDTKNWYGSNEDF